MPAPIEIAAWAALLGAVLWLSLRGWDSFQLGVYQDDAAYVVLAHSLAYGNEYGLVDQPGPPVPTKYGFVFPLLLAPVVRLFPGVLSAAAAVPLAATLANVSLLFWGWPLLSPTASRRWGLAAASLYGLAPLVVGHSRIAMTEPVFTALVLSALLLSEWCVRHESRWGPLALGVAIALTFYTRPIGAALGAAAGLRLGLGGRARDLPRVVLGGVAFAALVAIATPVDLRHLVPLQYANELRTGKSFALPPDAREPALDRGLRVGGGYVLRDIRRAIVPIGAGTRESDLAVRLGFPQLPEVIGGFVSAVTAIGLWRCLRTGVLAPSPLTFQLFYFMGILLWPWNDDRFLYPVQPFLSLEFLLGVASLGSWVAPASLTRGMEAGRIAAAAAWAALAVLSLSRSLVLQDSRSFTRDLRVGTTWLAANSSPDAIVMARYPAAIYLYSGRKTVELPEISSAEAFERIAAEKRIDFLLVGPALQWHDDGSIEYSPSDRGLLALLPEMEARGRLELVYESAPRQKVRVYRARPAHVRKP